MLMCKGADSHLIPRLEQGQETLLATTEDFLTDYAKDGLRTLILAQKKVDEDFFSDWSVKYSKALTTMGDAR